MALLGSMANNRSRIWRNSFICVITLLALQSIWASSPIILSESTVEFSVTRTNVEYFEDSSCELRLDQILKIYSEGRKFKPSIVQDLINENTASAYWLRFTLINHNTDPQQFIIEMFDFDIDEITLYYPDEEGKYVEFKSGYKFPFDSRQLNHKNVSFPIQIKGQKPITVYMRFKSQKLNVLEPMIRSYNRYMNYSLSEYIVLGLFYGLLLLIILYNMLYFIILKRMYYLWYVFYASAIMLHILAKNGIGFQYIWSDWPMANDYMRSTTLFVGTLAMMKFFINFFQLRTQEPRIFRTLCVLIVFRILYFFVQLVYPSFAFLDVIDVFYCQVVFLFSAQLYRAGMHTTKWFIMAYSFLNIFCIIKLFEHTTLIPSNVFTVYSINMGVIIQFVFLSIGIAEAVKEVYREKNVAQANLIIQYKQNEALKEQVNRELEEKVRERTQELQKTKQALEQRAEENLRMNMALDLANNQLQKYINSFALSVVTNTHVDFEAFKKAYPDDLSCMRYLRELKEKKGFGCKKCGHNKSIKGKAKFDVRCAKCDYNESLTAHTIFHKTKFSLQKAFYMLYLVSQTKTDISATELSRIMELQKATCSNFKNKILERMTGKSQPWDYLILDQN